MTKEFFIGKCGFDETEMFHENILISSTFSMKNYESTPYQCYYFDCMIIVKIKHVSLIEMKHFDKVISIFLNSFFFNFVLQEI